MPSRSPLQAADSSNAAKAAPRGTRKQGRLPHVAALDGLRGLASIAVLLHHSFYTDLPLMALSPVTHFLSLACGQMYLGVDLFFVLSGYLITSLLLLARRSPSYFHDFYWKRVFRILPALILVLLSTHFMGYTPWIGVVLALLFIANIRNFWGLTEIGPYWSLSIEEQFYLIWPMVVRKRRVRTLLKLLAYLIVGSILLRATSVALHHGRFHYTFMHSDGLAWGGVLAIFALRARLPFRSHAGGELWRGFGRVALGLGVLGTAAGIAVSLGNHPEFGAVLTFAPILFTGLLLYLITHRSSLIARLLASPPLRFLGDISYMVYLSHAYILEYYDQHMHGWLTHPTEAGLYLRLAVVLAATLLFCTASLYCFERPVGKLRRFVLGSG